MSQDSQRNLTIMSQETLKHIFESLEAVCSGDDVEFTKIIDRKAYEKEYDADDFKYQFNFERIRPLSTALPSFVEELDQQPVSAPLRSSPPLMVPNCVRADYEGPYGFQVFFGEQPRDTKSAPWIYSVALKKLYARKDAPCPVLFSVMTSDGFDTLMPAMFIRACMVFDRVEHSQDIVRRCPNHIHGDTKDANHKEHFIWCDNAGATYHTDGQGRHSVVVPYQRAATCMPAYSCVYAFKCLSSCVGGPNRRGMSVIFSLETDAGDVVGRRCIDVKVCACPGRDKKTDEGKAGAAAAGSTTACSAAPDSKDLPASSKANSPMDCPTRSSPAVAPVELMSPPVPTPTSSGRLMEIETYHLAKKPKLDDDVYVLYVKGRQDFELLRQIRDSLAVAHAVPASDQDATLHTFRRSEGLLVPRLDGTTAGNVSQISDRPNTAQCVSSATKKTAQSAHAPISSVAMPATQPPSTSTRERVEEWLASNGFQDYLEKFRASGYVFMDQLSSNLTLNDLEKMDIRKNDRTRIWRTLVLYKKKQYVEPENASQPSGDADVAVIAKQHRGGSSPAEASSSQRSISSQSGSFFPGLFELTRCSLKVKVARDSSERCEASLPEVSASTVSSMPAPLPDCRS